MDRTSVDRIPIPHCVQVEASSLEDYWSGRELCERTSLANLVVGSRSTDPPVKWTTSMPGEGGGHNSKIPHLAVQLFLCSCDRFMLHLTIAGNFPALQRITSEKTCMVTLPRSDMATADAETGSSDYRAQVLPPF